MYVYEYYTVRVKKSYQYRLPFLCFHVNRFTVPVSFSALFCFTVLPFHSPFYRSVHRFTFLFCRFTVPCTDHRESGRVSRGPKHVKCSATILTVDTYDAELFGEPPSPASGPSACCRTVQQAAAWSRYNCAAATASLSTHTPKS